MPNPDWDDRDGDGTPDVCDNCPCSGNPSQDDIDGDGNGNACDTTFTPINPPPPPGTPAPDGDEDGDGFRNDEDPCPCDASNMCTQCPIQLVELPIYGLGRVGVAKPTGIVLNTPANTGPTYSRPIGEKFYELADHLGNVRMVISDIKRSMLTGTVPGKFFADVHTYMNAYPYGMPMPGRWWDSALAASPRATYRYGYNGMEGDPEVLGDGNHFTTPFREYDPRVARWWSNDPIVQPWQSPYMAMGGNPIALADPLGLMEKPPEGVKPGSSPGETMDYGGITYTWIEQGKGNWGWSRQAVATGERMDQGSGPSESDGSIARPNMSQYLNAPVVVGAAPDEFQREWQGNLAYLRSEPYGSYDSWARPYYNLKYMYLSAVEDLYILEQKGGMRPAANEDGYIEDGFGNPVSEERVTQAVITASGFGPGSLRSGARGIGARSAIVPGGGLVAHEAAGGHVIARHVGKTAADLAARLTKQPSLPAASTFVSRAEAESMISRVLNVRADEVSAWLNRGAVGRLALHAKVPGGLVLQRGSAAAVAGSGAQVVLQGNGSGSFYILTGFPTP